MGADSINFCGQLRGDKIECPCSGVTISGRVWRKVPGLGVCVDSRHKTQTDTHFEDWPEEKVFLDWKQPDRRQSERLRSARLIIAWLTETPGGCLPKSFEHEENKPRLN